MTVHPARRALLAVLACVALAAPSALAAQDKPTVTVFAAASLKNVLDDAGAAYGVKSGVTVHFSYAASSAIARQIEQSSPGRSASSPPTATGWTMSPSAIWSSPPAATIC